jgi:hypothetical protein
MLMPSRWLRDSCTVTSNRRRVVGVEPPILGDQLPHLLVGLHPQRDLVPVGRVTPATVQHFMM